MLDQRRLILAVLAVLFLAVTTATWAGVTGPGTTASEPETTVPAPEAPPAPETTVPAPEAPPATAPAPPSTSEVPEAPPFEDVARDLGERDQPKAAKKQPQGPAAAGKADGKAAKEASKAAKKAWKAAKKAAKAECKRRFSGRERGQCISAAARAHKNPKARGHR